jgi:tartrate dehydrogenase/decarboxylase / D-malate dehydrogenase
VAAEHTDGRAAKGPIDVLAARLVPKPDTVDVIVASNLFGNTAADLAVAIVESTGMASSANRNVARCYPSVQRPLSRARR